MHGMAESDQGPTLGQAAPADHDAAAQRLAERKSLLRKDLIAARAGLSEADRAAAGRALREAILQMPATGMAGTIAAYVSAGTEPETRGLLFALWKRGSYILLPVLRLDNDLDWASYEGPDSLAPGRFDVLEPTEPGRGITAIASADLVLVPALAADRGGHRLGRGGGSYDRALARVGPAVPTIALLYDTELLAAVPAGSHDQRVRAVAQPGQGITKLG